MCTLHFDCFSGISGDMTLAALIDAGADANAIRAGLDSLGCRSSSASLNAFARAGSRRCRFTSKPRKKPPIASCPRWGSNSGAGPAQ